MNPRCARQAGFTLIELLVVVAIIAILAALLLPVLSKAKSYAHSSACKNHLRQMGAALQMYVHDSQNRYPHYLGPAGPSYGDATGNGALGLVYWSSKLFPYYAMGWTNKLYHCPGYKGRITGPDTPGAIDRTGSYAYNADGVRSDDRAYGHFGLGPVIFWKDQGGKSVPAVSEAMVNKPAEMLAIGDSLKRVDETGGDDFGHCASDMITMPYATPHGKNFNELFCDTHISPIAPTVLFNPRNTAPMWNYDHQPHPEFWIP